MYYRTFVYGNNFKERTGYSHSHMTLEYGNMEKTIV